ncbi:hypothetical protein PENTCL1PPCAC_29897, partial [Pristionchus entomophagus]
RMRSLFVLLVSSVALVACGTKQTVGVRGTLMCGDKPLVDATVKLWELDTWPNPDDDLSTVKTDKNGRFEIYGTEEEVLTAEFVVKFYHRCNNNHMFDLIPKLCKRKITYVIPKSYINKGPQVGKWYEIGQMNMEAKQPKEDTECSPF